MVRTIGHENRMSPAGVEQDGDRFQVPAPSRQRWRMATSTTRIAQYLRGGGAYWGGCILSGQAGGAFFTAKMPGRVEL